MDQRQLTEAIQIGQANAREVVEICLAASDAESALDVIAARFGLSPEQADVIGSIQFKRLNAQARADFASRPTDS